MLILPSHTMADPSLTSGRKKGGVKGLGDKGTCQYPKVSPSLIRLSWEIPLAKSAKLNSKIVIDWF